MAVILNIKMPECCDLCKFGCWSNLHQTASCYLTDDEQMFGDFSLDYKVRRSAKCPMEEHEPKVGRWEDRYRARWDGTLYWFRACSACDFERDDCNFEKDTPYCPNCGAPLTDFECDYCGTIVQDFTLMDESKPFYLRFKFRGTIYTFKAGLMSIVEDMSMDSVPTFTFGVYALGNILMEREKK